MGINTVGRQVFWYSPIALANSAVPFGDNVTPVNDWSYRRNENGRVMKVVPSSVWLPISNVPGTIVAVPVAMA